MKYSIEQITQGENEVIVRFSEMDHETSRVIDFLKNNDKKLSGYVDGKVMILDRSSILYIESVDGKTFAYTEDLVVRLDQSLNQLEILLEEINFFRCSKSMILNIDKVSTLKSLASNRIDATMKNGEHIMISRTYASEFRKLLRQFVH
jgi:DNA-binding LytR/AlgR family response regulator